MLNSLSDRWRAIRKQLIYAGWHKFNFLISIIAINYLSIFNANKIRTRKSSLMFCPTFIFRFNCFPFITINRYTSFLNLKQTSAWMIALPWGGGRGGGGGDFHECKGFSLLTKSIPQLSIQYPLLKIKKKKTTNKNCYLPHKHKSQHIGEVNEQAFESICGWAKNRLLWCNQETNSYSDRNTQISIRHFTLLPVFTLI